MANATIEKYQQDLVNNLLKQMDSNPDFLKRWSEIPFNPYNGKGLNLYSGINQINLSMHLSQTTSADPRYYTFKQIKDLGLKLKKGSKGVQVQFYKIITKETKKLNKKGQSIAVQIPFVRLTHAFNAQDIEGLDPYEKTKGFAALKDDRDLSAKLNDVIKNSGMNISHGGNRAFYIGGLNDSIMMPPPERFSSKQAYAATLLHELAHSTRHPSRQNRDMGNKNLNRASYAKEELRAELSSVFMCQRLGISYQLEKDQTHIENSAAYLKGWKGILNNDKAEFFKAAKDANKITAYLVDGKSFKRTLNKTNDQQALNLSEQQIKQTNFLTGENKMSNTNNDKKTKGSIVNNVMDFFEKNGFKKQSDNHKKLVKSNGDTVEAINNNTAIRIGNHNFGFAEIHNHTAESIKKITTKAFKERDFYPTARQKLDKKRTNEKATGRGSR